MINKVLVSNRKPGAQPGNLNALKHGRYSPRLIDLERQAVALVAADSWDGDGIDGAVGELGASQARHPGKLAASAGVSPALPLPGDQDLAHGKHGSAVSEPDRQPAEGQPNLPPDNAVGEKPALKINGLEEEVRMLRRLIRKAFALANELESLEQTLTALSGVGLSAARLAIVLRTQRELATGAEDDLRQKIMNALDEVRRERREA